jgi:site-specific recombinase XerD
MFETLFTYAGVVRRHQEASFADQRRIYLSGLAAQGLARGTLLRRARYCLCVAIELERRPPDWLFSEDEVDQLAEEWAAQRVASGRASSQKWPKENFRFAAGDFLRSLGRLRATPDVAPGLYDAKLDEFVAAQQEGPWQSEATCRVARWQITRFLDHLEQRGVALVDVTATDIDAFFLHMAQRWSRSSLRTSAKMLRAWFGYCQRRGWARAGLADAILSPRVFGHEGLPLGPTWDTVGRVLAQTDAGAPASLRDHAIILLLLLYNTGARASEASELAVSDLRLDTSPAARFHGKGRKIRTCPLWARTASILRGLLGARLDGPREAPVFLNVRRQRITRYGVYALVARTFDKAAETTPSLRDKRVSPHTIRHTTAVHLLRAGVDINTIRAWLGHVSLETTNRYAEVDLEMKAQALQTCAVCGPDPSPAPAPSWHTDSELMAFLASL